MPIHNKAARQHFDLSSGDKVTELIENEEYWRAKEVLQGRLAKSNYDLIENYSDR